MGRDLLLFIKPKRKEVAGQNKNAGCKSVCIRKNLVKGKPSLETSIFMVG